MIKLPRKIALLTAGFILSLSLFTGTAQAAEASCPEPDATSQTEDGVMPLRDVIDWRFKIENNHLYKRLYNYSTGKWIGPWILIP